MLRLLSFPACLFGATCVISGCASGSDVDLELPATEARIAGLEARYALGSRATIRISGAEPLTLESSDPSVVRVEAFHAGVAELRFVGPGRARLVLENEESRTGHPVEVVRHETSLVLLSETPAIPIGELADQSILAGRQDILILYLDAEDTRLYGYGLAELTLSPGMELCNEGPISLEHHCLYIREPGPHVLEVDVGDERHVLRFQAVAQSDVVAVKVLQPDEDDLRAGTWVQIDVVGLTEDGSHVASLHPRFVLGAGAYFGYFAYQYDPHAQTQTLGVEALDWPTSTEFRGVPSEENALACALLTPGKKGPIPTSSPCLGLTF